MQQPAMLQQWTAWARQRGLAVPHFARPPRLARWVILALGVLALVRGVWHLSTSESTPGPNGYLFLFGDSFTTINVHIHYDKPTLEKPLGLDYPGITTAGIGEPNWVGVLVHSLLKKYIAFDFAVGGALTNYKLFPKPEEAYPDFGSQVKDFSFFCVNRKDFAPGWKPWNSVFTVWFGNNDVAGSFGDEKPAERRAKILDSYFETMTTLYSYGARKFIIFTVPPLYHNAWYTRDFQEQHNSTHPLAVAIDGWNKELKWRTERWTTPRKVPANPHVDVRLFDVDKQLLEPLIADGTIVSNCSMQTLGEDEKKAGKQCLWSDNFHLSPKVHRLLAQAVGGLLNDMRIGKTHASRFQKPVNG